MVNNGMEKLVMLQKIPLKILLFIALFVASVSSYSSNETVKMLRELDEHLSKKQQYFEVKSLLIKQLTSDLSSTEKLGQTTRAYDLCNLLIDEYESFSYDSAFKYVQKINVLARKSGDQNKIAQAKIKMGFTLLSSGLFKESLDTLNSIQSSLLPENIEADYYNVIARTYYDLADYNNDEYFSSLYRKTGTQYLDSSIALLEQNTSEYWAVMGLRRMKVGDLAGSSDAFNYLITKFDINDHTYAIATSSLGYLYTLMGRTNEAIDMLIRAAIADITSSTKETVALRNLAVHLFEKREIKRAYSYIKIALADATEYNARHRKVEVGSVLPIIEGEMLTTVERQRKQLLNYSFMVSMLSILVISFFVIIFLQLRKIKKVKSILQETNKNLLEINTHLVEANKIKEEYIGYFFNINSEYIDKIEAFQKSIHRKIIAKQYGDLDTIIKNSDLKKERENLFINFDKIFLKIFPNFVVEFNKLLKPEDQILPEKGELLNADLRIFALIRLGITDNDKIAKFLNYSVNTIYTYKTKIKNKSIVDRDMFEQKIMEIKAM
jgi:tetratricopeptide (TPR) repeat protein